MMMMMIMTAHSVNHSVNHSVIDVNSNVAFHCFTCSYLDHKMFIMFMM